MSEGKVFKYKDNVDTDVIIPARYLNDACESNLRAHVMEDLDADFATSVKEGDIIAAGFNFGCGSSREHAPLALKCAGIKLVAAKSFARIFFRNAINIGLFVVEDAKLADELCAGDKIAIQSDTLINLTANKTYKLPKPDPFIQKIIDCGGLMNSVKK